MRTLILLPLLLLFACGTDNPVCMNLNQPAAKMGCPTGDGAENAFAAATTACGFVDADIDPDTALFSDSGKDKICMSCACRQALLEWHSYYANCTSADPNWSLESSNAALAQDAKGADASCQ